MTNIQSLLRESLQSGEFGPLFDWLEEQGCDNLKARITHMLDLGKMNWLTDVYLPRIGFEPLAFLESRAAQSNQLSDMSNELKRLGHMLAGLNYVVSLDVYDVIHAPGANPTEIILECFPEATIGNFTASDATNVLDAFDRDIHYLGDSSSGPKPSTLNSIDFKALFKKVRAYFAASCHDADTIHEFWLSDGHPFYPVQWDFAFLLGFDAHSTIWIGSSSD